MAELGWIKAFLFLVLELQVTVTANGASVLKRAGDDIMLSCQNVVDGQQNCNGTSWVFSGSKSSKVVALVAYGETEEDVRTRMSVTPNCSLVIKNITAEDVGLYECQQDKSEYPESLIYLSVVTMTKHEENQTVTFSCSVTKSGSCKHKVKWLFNHQEEEKKKLKTSESDCSATVTFLESVFINSSSVDQLFQCEVTQSGDKNVQLFSFSRQSSGSTAATHKPTTEGGNSTKTTSGSTPYIGAGVALVIVVIIAVVVIRWRAKRNKTRWDENALDVSVDDGVSYASLRHPKTNSGKVLVHGDPETVTYSTLRSHSSSAAASNDPNNLYSLVTFN